MVEDNHGTANDTCNDIQKSSVKCGYEYILAR